MTEQHKAAIEQLKQQDLARFKLEDAIALLNSENFTRDFASWRQFTKALFPPLKRRMMELSGNKQQGYVDARQIYSITDKAIKGNVDWLHDFLLQLDPMHTTAEQEQAAIEHLKPGYDPAWFQLIEALTPPVYRKLHQVTGGDEEKILNYVGEIFALVVRAFDKVEVDVK